MKIKYISEYYEINPKNLVNNTLFLTFINQGKRTGRVSVKFYNYKNDKYYTLLGLNPDIYFQIEPMTQKQYAVYISSLTTNYRIERSAKNINVSAQ